MEFAFIRRIITFTYTLILLLIIGLGYCYTNEMNNEFKENAQLFSDYWTENGRLITFPFSSSDEIEIENVLPVVYGDQLLVLRVFYENFEVFIDNESILKSRDHYLFGHKSYVGNKEIWIPLKPEYSNKNIKVRIKMQDSIYGSELTEGLLTTRSGYGITQFSRNVPSVILYVVFMVAGVVEICIAGYFIVKRTALIRKLTFEALFYAGCFSIVSAQWIINETRLPFIILGYMTGFSILNIVSFLLMPLLFFEMTRALFLRISFIDNLIDGAIALSILFGCIFAIIGLCDWGSLVYLAHIIDLVVLILVGLYSYQNVRRDKGFSSRTGFVIANFVFILLAGIAIIEYIGNINSNYILIILIDLMLFALVHVGLIYRRIGLNVKEEREFAQAKRYAFTDELTEMGNRRHFYNVIEDYERHRLPKDLTYIAIDVNRLKYYNDNMGHEAGDELLKGTADCMKKAFATSSTATLGRLGGDEFGILIIATDVEINRRIAELENLLDKWKGEYIDGISIAIGYASISENLEYSIAQIGRLADERMYKDKQNYYETSGFDRRTSH